jgi:hypothetical protein
MEAYCLKRIFNLLKSCLASSIYTLHVITAFIITHWITESISTFLIFFTISILTTSGCGHANIVLAGSKGRTLGISAADKNDTNPTQAPHQLRAIIVTVTDCADRHAERHLFIIFHTLRSRITVFVLIARQFF